MIGREVGCRAVRVLPAEPVVDTRAVEVADRSRGTTTEALLGHVVAIVDVAMCDTAGHLLDSSFLPVVAEARDLGAVVLHAS